ncbi:hypothetical protein EBZ37_07450 [bacterium]|nr:hypothetical protein [bacterium]
MPYSSKGLSSSVRRRIRILERAANRYRNFSPQTISRFNRTALALLCLAIFFRLGSWIQTSGLMPPALQGLDDQIIRNDDNVKFFCTQETADDSFQYVFGFASRSFKNILGPPSRLSA